MDGARQAIGELIERYSSAWRRHDMQTWGELFTEDADFVTHAGYWWSPNAQNVAGHLAVSEYVIGQKSRYQLEVAAISLISDDVALVHARWSWPQFAPSAADVPHDVRGIITMVLVCRSGKWLIRASQNTKTPLAQNSDRSANAA